MERLCQKAEYELIEYRPFYLVIAHNEADLLPVTDEVYFIRRKRRAAMSSTADSSNPFSTGDGKKSKRSPVRRSICCHSKLSKIVEEIDACGS